MAETVLKTIIQVRRDTAANWETNKTIVPAAGEPCLNLDTGVVVYGNGTDTYETLVAAYEANKAVMANHYEGVKQDGESDNDVIERVLGKLEASAQTDDIFVVKSLISDGKYSYTAFVYNGTAWAAMDGNYNAKNVYFDQNLTFTYQFGKYKPDSSGSVSIPTYDDGMSLYDMLMKTHSEEKNPTVDTPSISFTTGNQSGEVGSKYTIPTATLKVTDVGSYTYGSKDANDKTYSAEDTGVTFAVGDVTITQGATSKSNESALGKNGTLALQATTDGETLFTDTTITYAFSAKADYTESDRVPVTNLGNKVDSLKIKSGSLTGNCSAVMTGWRKMFMGTVTDASAAITSDVIRGLTLVNKQVQTTAQTFTVPVGTAKIIVSAPKGYSIAKVEYFTMSWEEFSGFVQAESVQVADARGGANGLTEYTVYTYTPASAFEADTQFRVTLKKA